ncbi:hypothetical protein GCM10017673_28240 [Streptosporangium violaceochromogenes]|nr:hypothetical protein GCM10017673_28240 [Streptosporangium violaceochromogenes]
MTSQARDLVTGVAAVVVGGVVAVIAATIPNTTGTAVGPGAFPLVVGVAVVLAGLAVAVPALRRGNGGEEEEEDEGGGKPLPTRLVLPAGIAAFCAVALTVSLTIASGAAFCLCCRYMAGYRWPRSALIGLAGAAVVHLVFRSLLDVPLPGDMVL